MRSRDRKESQVGLPTRNVVCPLAGFVLSLATAVPVCAAAPEIRYLYDPKGQLVGLIAPDGAIATAAVHSSGP